MYRNNKVRGGAGGGAQTGRRSEVEESDRVES